MSDIKLDFDRYFNIIWTVINMDAEYTLRETGL